MTLIDGALARKPATILILLLLLVAGMYSYITIPKESDPDINIPIIYTSLVHIGISPEDAERLLVKPVEQELSSIEGVKEMTATAYLGGANVVLEFQAGFDADKALTDVREAVDKARSELPADAEEPSVNEVNFSLFPVLVVTLSGDVPERSLLQVAERLQDRIEGIPQVLEANLAGDREHLVEIIIDPVLVESYGLSAAEILPFFQRSNALIAAGNLDTGAGRFSVKVPGLFEKLEDISTMPVRVNGDSVITVGDIATIRKTFRDRETYARMNGRPTIALEVVKRTGKNVIETIAAVKAMVEQEQGYWPDGIEVIYSQDSSTDIRNMLLDLQNNIISAVLLVMVVILAALGMRSAGLVGISIPGSFLSGILIVSLMGLTVNVVVLFSLILSVGLLVDGAVVVTEYADRKIAEGMSRAESYARASKRMAWPIIASTATTLAAFAPLLFWPGIPGQFMRYMPITLIAVLGASLVMALIFVPTLGTLSGANWLRLFAVVLAAIGITSGGAALGLLLLALLLMIFAKPIITKWRKRFPAKPLPVSSLAADERPDVAGMKGITGSYVRMLDKALHRPALVLLAALIILIGVVFTYGKIGKGVEFFPDIEPETAVFLVHARGNLSIEEQDALVREVEERVLTIKGFKSVYTRTGQKRGGGNDEVAEDVIGRIQVDLADWQRRKPASELLDVVLERTKDIPGIWVEPRQNQAGPQSGKDIIMQLAAREPALLKPAVKQMRSALKEIGGFKNAEDTRPLPGIEWELKVDRAQAAKFGLDLQQVGSNIRMITNGMIAAEYRPNYTDEEVDIVLRFPEEDRTIDRLSSMRIETAQGSIPISNFVERRAKPRVSQIERADQQRIYKVRADVEGEANIAAKIDEIRNWVGENPLPDGVILQFKGDDEEQRTSMQFLMKAFAVALFVMGIILVTQFNSFYSALLILSAVIMSTIGVLIGLMVTGQAFGVIMTGVGVIALAGIVVNNNIVLIDTHDVIKRDFDYTPRETILLTGAQRLRPVLLTTVTTVLGLLPMVMQLNIDFISRTVNVGAPSTQWWVQLATAVVYGLVFSTVLTLVVTPCALLVKVNVLGWWEKRFRD